MSVPTPPESDLGRPWVPFEPFFERRDQAWEQVRELEERAASEESEAAWIAASKDRRRARLRFDLPVALAGLAVLATVTTIDFLLFRALGANYFDWYLHSGFVILLLFGVVTIAVDLDRHVGLISAHPLSYAAETAWVLANLSGAIAQQLLTRERPDRDLADGPYGSLQSRFRLPALDRALALLFALAIATAMLAWVLIVAPLQYWVNLVCGAPARVALASPDTLWEVERLGRVQLAFGGKDQRDVLEQKLEDTHERGEVTEVGFAARPVAFTAAISATVLFVISRFV
jgi:hypothetical protein